MKLKLESKDAFTILTVSEALDPKQLPILRAGVAKLLQSRGPGQAKPSGLILDLTAVPAQDLDDAEVIEAFAAIRKSATAAGTRLLLASNRPGLGDAPSVAACLAQLKPASQVAGSAAATTAPEAIEAELTRSLESLKAERDTAQKAVDARAAESDEIRRLQKENSNAKRLIQFLELEIAAQLRARITAPIAPAPELQARLADITEVLDSVTQSLAASGGKSPQGAPSPPSSQAGG